MPAPPDFRLYHGNDLDLLAALLALQLATPAPGAPVLEPETVLIPQPAMRRWLQNTLAEKHGIAANLRFLTPGEFVSQALAANLDGSDAAVANADTLRWRLWALLADEAAMAAPVFAPLRPVLSGDDRALAAWSLAGEVAQAFEKYQAWRRGWLLRWDSGADPGDWQAELWRRATRGQPHRARRLDAYLQRFDGPDAVAPSGLPSRLFAFACQNVSPDVLRVIASAALSGPLHFFFVSPVAGWWGDLMGARERLRADGDGVFAADADSPLLAREKLHIADLRGEPMIFYPRNSGVGIHEQFLRLCGEAGFVPNIVQEVRESATIISLAASGLGVAVVPSELQCINVPNIRFKPLADEGAMTYLVMASRAGEASTLVANLRRMVQASIARSTAPVDCVFPSIDVQD